MSPRLTPRHKRIGAVVLGTVLLAGGVAVGLGLDRRLAGRSLVPAVAGPTVSLLLAVGTLVAVLVVAGLVAMRVLGESTDGSDRQRTADLPEPPTRSADDTERVGARIDGPLTEASAGEWATYTGRRDVRDRLRAVAIALLRERAEAAEGRAVDAVDEGTWTTDPRAAAFLAETAPEALPIHVRIVDWVGGDPFRRRVEATVDEIERLADGESPEGPLG